MSLRFPYLQVAKGQLIVSLDGKVYRPRPVIGVTIIGPAGAVPHGDDATLTGEDVLPGFQCRVAEFFE